MNNTMTANISLWTSKCVLNNNNITTNDIVRIFGACTRGSFGIHDLTNKLPNRSLSGSNNDGLIHLYIIYKVKVFKYII